MEKPGNRRRAKANPKAAAFDRVNRPLSMVSQVEQALRQAIAADCFPSGKLPNGVDLAEQFGVSRETVRLAAEALQREGLLVKIRNRGTFTRPPGIRGRVRTIKTKVLGYLQTDFVATQGREEVANREISGRMLQGALAAAGREGFQLIVQHTPSMEWRKAVQDFCDGGRLRGLICVSYNEEKMLRHLAASGLPTVILDEDTNVPQIHSVRDDCFDGARQAILYLAQLGHRRIVNAHWNRADMNRWRPLGYRKGLREAGLPHRRQWEILTELTETGARHLVDRVLALTPFPTALYCFNNTLASFAISELQRRGLRVPEDISVMGAGGEEIPGLTCHQPDWYLMGRKAVQILLRPVADREPSGPEHILAPHTLRVGQTTAAPGNDAGKPVPSEAGRKRRE